MFLPLPSSNELAPVREVKVTGPAVTGPVSLTTTLVRILARLLLPCGSWHWVHCSSNGPSSAPEAPPGQSRLEWVETTCWGSLWQLKQKSFGVRGEAPRVLGC